MLLDNNTELDSNFVDLHVISINIQNSIEQESPEASLAEAKMKIDALQKKF
jgi:hypothetical protein